MLKFFVNSYFAGEKVSVREFNDNYIAKLLSSDVYTDRNFDCNDIVCLLMLDSAVCLLEILRAHSIDARVALRYNYGCGYLGWLLVVETDNRAITPIVSRFFSWNRIESQDVLSFEEIIDKH